MGNLKLKSILDIFLIAMASLFTSIVLTVLASPIFELLILLIQKQLKFERWLVYLKILNYVGNPFVHNLNVAPFTLSNHGLLHFQDVKKLINVCEILAIFLNFISYLRLRKLSRTYQLWKLHYGLKFAIWGGLPVAFGLASNFNNLFIAMHHLLFRNDYWIFDSVKDSVILLMPESLFIMCALSILGIYELLLNYLKRRINRRK